MSHAQIAAPHTLDADLAPCEFIARDNKARFIELIERGAAVDTGVFEPGGPLCHIAILGDERCVVEAGR